MSNRLMSPPLRLTTVMVICPDVPTCDFSVPSCAQSMMAPGGPTLSACMLARSSLPSCPRLIMILARPLANVAS
jgi:hypothetical protein